MNSKGLYYILTSSLLILLIALIAGGYYSTVILKQQSSDLVDSKTQSAALDLQQLQLIKDRKDVAKYTSLNKIAQSVVPQDKDQAEAVRQIVNLASDSGIKQLSSVTFPSSTLGGGTAKKDSLTQLEPVLGISGVYTLQITVQQDVENSVSYNTFLNFLRKLEQNRRTAQVSSITVQPDSTHPNLVSFTLIVDEYIKP
ncbi:MAG: hypothetical protein ABI220_03290 [Candidatus Saccharimonadales bacterium]